MKAVSCNLYKFDRSRENDVMTNRVVRYKYNLPTYLGTGNDNRMVTVYNSSFLKRLKLLKIAYYRKLLSTPLLKVRTTDIYVGRSDAFDCVGFP